MDAHRRDQPPSLVKRHCDIRPDAERPVRCASVGGTRIGLDIADHIWFIAAKRIAESTAKLTESVVASGARSTSRSVLAGDVKGLFVGVKVAVRDIFRRKILSEHSRRGLYHAFRVGQLTGGVVQDGQETELAFVDPECGG